MTDNEKKIRDNLKGKSGLFARISIRKFQHICRLLSIAVIVSSVATTSIVAAQMTKPKPPDKNVVRITTFIPEPRGRYRITSVNALHLEPVLPADELVCDAAAEGIFYLFEDPGNNIFEFRLCDEANWQTIGEASGFVQSEGSVPTAPIVHLNDDDPGVLVGIGTDTPDLKLHIDGVAGISDGGILAVGAINQGVSWNDGDPTGRVFGWFSKNADFMAGKFTNDMGQLKIFTGAMGYRVMLGFEQTGAGLYDVAAGGASNIIVGHYSTIIGGERNDAKWSNPVETCAVIAGGGGELDTAPEPDIDYKNEALNSYTTVGGGAANRAVLENSTVAGGFNNEASKIYSTVAGGEGNLADGDYSVVSGGFENKAGKLCSSVAGGMNNTADGAYSVVSGGKNNSTKGKNSSMGGGSDNEIDRGIVDGASADFSIISGGNSNSVGTTSGAAKFSTISGGGNNVIAPDISGLANYSVVKGGLGNEVYGSYSTVSGGTLNEITGDRSTISGGGSNRIEGSSVVISGGQGNYTRGSSNTITGGKDNQINAPLECSTISGGLNNTITLVAGATISGGSGNTVTGSLCGVVGGGENNESNIYDFVGGGFNNKAGGAGNSVVPGGDSNTASGQYSFVLGGRGNETAAQYSAVGGRNMRLSSSANNTFLWGNDSSATPSTYDISNAFIICPNGECAVGIGVNNPKPDVALDVNGTITITDGPTSGSALLCIADDSGDSNIDGIIYRVSPLSSRKYKRDIRNLDVGAQKFLKLRPVSFVWKESEAEDKGFIAEEVEEVIPELVVHKEGQPESVKYSKVVIYLLKGVQDQQRLYKKQQQRIELQKKEIEELKNKLEDI